MPRKRVTYNGEEYRIYLGCHVCKDRIGTTDQGTCLCGATFNHEDSRWVFESGVMCIPCAIRAGFEW